MRYSIIAVLLLTLVGCGSGGGSSDTVATTDNSTVSSISGPDAVDQIFTLFEEVEGTYWAHHATDNAFDGDASGPLEINGNYATGTVAFNGFSLPVGGSLNYVEHLSASNGSLSIKVTVGGETIVLWTDSGRNLLEWDNRTTGFIFTSSRVINANG